MPDQVAPVILEASSRERVPRRPSGTPRLVRRRRPFCGAGRCRALSRGSRSASTARPPYGSLGGLPMTATLLVAVVEHPAETPFPTRRFARRPLPLRCCEQRLLDDCRVGVPCAFLQLGERRGRLGLQHRLDTLGARQLRRSKLRAALAVPDEAGGVVPRPRMLLVDFIGDLLLFLPLIQFADIPPWQRARQPRAGN